MVSKAPVPWDLTPNKLLPTSSSVPLKVFKAPTGLLYDFFCLVNCFLLEHGVHLFSNIMFIFHLSYQIGGYMEEL